VLGGHNPRPKKHFFFCGIFFVFFLLCSPFPKVFGSHHNKQVVFGFFLWGWAPLVVITGGFFWGGWVFWPNNKKKNQKQTYPFYGVQKKPTQVSFFLCSHSREKPKKQPTNNTGSPPTVFFSFSGGKKKKHPFFFLGVGFGGAEKTTSGVLFFFFGFWGRFNFLGHPQTPFLIFTPKKPPFPLGFLGPVFLLAFTSFQNFWKPGPTPKKLPRVLAPKTQQKQKNPSGIWRWLFCLVHLWEKKKNLSFHTQFFFLFPTKKQVGVFQKPPPPPTWGGGGGGGGRGGRGGGALGVFFVENPNPCGFCKNVSVFGF